MDDSEECLRAVINAAGWIVEPGQRQDGRIDVAIPGGPKYTMTPPESIEKLERFKEDGQSGNMEPDDVLNALKNAGVAIEDQ